MHKYLNAIGYGRLTSEKELNELLKEAENVYSHHELVALDPDIDYCEYRTECADDIGLCICGTSDTEEHFERHYYYPYFKGSGVTSNTDVMIERRMDKENIAHLPNRVLFSLKIRNMKFARKWIELKKQSLSAK